MTKFVFINIFMSWAMLWYKKVNFDKPIHKVIIMEQPKQKLGSLKRPTHFIVYCISFMLYATAMAGVGPFIPYLADRTGHK